jgi:hypothetical protein
VSAAAARPVRLACTPVPRKPVLTAWWLAGVLLLATATLARINGPEGDPPSG